MYIFEDIHFFAFLSLFQSQYQPADDTVTLWIRPCQFKHQLKLNKNKE